MGLLFENVSHDDFVPPSALGKGKRKGKIVDGVVESPESIDPATAAGARVRRKSLGKAFADEADVEHRVKHDDDDDDDSHSGSESDDDGPSASAISAPAFLNAPHMKPPTPSSSSSKLVRELTYCHHCRCKMRRPQMRCTSINKMSERCAKMFCDNCFEKRYALHPQMQYTILSKRRYPDLTFYLSAGTFACTVCRNYCNCSICARKRGEEYINERGDSWRGWLAQQGASYQAAAAAASTLTSKKNKKKSRNPKTAPAAKQRSTTATTSSDTQVPDESWSTTAVVTISGESLGSAILQGNAARILPVPQATDPTPPAGSTSTTSIPQPAPEQQQQPQKHRYVFIGKPLKGWGPVVSLPDPEPDQPEQLQDGEGERKGDGKGAWEAQGQADSVLFREP